MFLYNQYEQLKLYFQIEHAQHLASGTPSRFGKEGVVASVQVYSYYHYLVFIFWFYKMIVEQLLQCLHVCTCTYAIQINDSWGQLSYELLDMDHIFVCICLVSINWYFLVAIHQQPDHLLDDADSASRKLGNDRAERESYLFKSLLDSNALVAFGSDWPVSILELLVHMFLIEKWN